MAVFLRWGPTLRSATLNLATRYSSRTFSLATPSKARTFEHAVALLETLQSNKQVVKSLSSSDQDANAAAIPEMLAWLRRAGYAPDDFVDRLKFIHVAGTKGKGSVCAMVESVLLQYRGSAVGSQKNGLGKVGLYSSPHLMTVRERMRIDGIPVSKRMFARYFFDLWDRFSYASSTEASAEVDHHMRPSYFRYLTILALHTFIQEGVETAIIECGIGGEYDSTNILPPDAVTVTAITSLGVDHTGMLGETIEEIAWHKAGIMKEDVPAFTVKQRPNAQAVLEQRASEKGVDLTVVEPSPAIEEVKLGLEGDFQRQNAALAVSIAASHLNKLGISVSSHGANLPGNFINGLKTVAWPGRCQVLRDGNITWYLDGAHTAESIGAAAVWFHGHLLRAQGEAKPPTATMLIFNQVDRDGVALLRNLMTVLYTVQCVDVVHSRSSTFSRPAQLLGRSIFTYAAFPTNTPFVASTDGQKTGVEDQERLANAYQSLDGNALHMSYATIEEAVQLAKRVSEGDERLLVFVTGSLYLVGGVLQVLEHVEVGK